jgi:DNA polymerase-3 subunit delta'
LIVLSTPAVAEVTDFLIKDGAEEQVADYAARVSQGHIGRARGLARDADSRKRRNEVVGIPARLKSLGACMNAASELNDVAKQEADAQSAAVDERERADLDRAYGVVERGRRPKEYAPALRDLEKSQKTRAKRRLLDVTDRSLMDLVSVYRDALALQLRTGSAIANTELRDDLAVLAAQPPESNVRRIDAIFAAREQMLEFNVPVLLVLESLMVALQLSE